MTALWKNILIVVAGVIVSVLLVSKCDRRKPTERTVVVRDTIVKTVVEEVPFTIVDTVYVKSKPITITVPDSSTSDPNDSVPVATTKYEGKAELLNGTIDYEIYADKLHATKFRLTTKDTIIKETIDHVIIMPVKPRLYGTVGMDSGIQGFSPQAASAGLTYTHRQKWGVGVEVRHDFSGMIPSAQATTLGLRIHFGL